MQVFQRLQAAEAEGYGAQILAPLLDLIVAEPGIADIKKAPRRTGVSIRWLAIDYRSLLPGVLSAVVSNSSASPASAIGILLLREDMDNASRLRE